ncbi:efflux RND transporter permease subunit [Escherichia coli]
MDKEGKGLIEATLDAVRMCLRLILMTSLAFILGVMPLVISTGAGSGAHNAVGTGVMGGTGDRNGTGNLLLCSGILCGGSPPL